MPNILFANLGNRSLSFDGYYFDKDYASEFTQKLNPDKLSFIDYTKHIADLLAAAIPTPTITLNILHPALNKKQFDAIKIVATQSGHKNDTLYSAHIIKHLLQTQYGYHYNQIDILTITKPINDTAFLLNYYRNQLGQLRDKYFVHLCDAGGTPQQKSAMKLMAEYVLPDDAYDVWYVNEQGDVIISNQVEYRNVINGHALIKLAEAGNYLGALEIENQTRLTDLHVLKTTKDKVYRLLVLGHIAIHNAWKQQHWCICKMGAGDFTNSKNEVLDKPLKFYTRILNTCIKDAFANEKQVFLCGEFLYLANYFYQKKQYNSSILHFSRFYESLFDALILHATGIDPVAKLDKLSQYVAANISEFTETYRGSVIDESKLIMILYANNEIINKLTYMIAAHFSRIEYTTDAETGVTKLLEDKGATKRINNVRNKIAHEGLLVDETYIKNELDYYPQLLTDIMTLIDFDTYDFFGELLRELRLHQSNKNLA